MSLVGYQLHFFKHLVNLWQPSRAINATTGVVGDETYTLAYSGVACYIEFTKNLSDPIEGLGRLKRPTEFTTDFIHFDQSQEIGADWIVKNVSLSPDGTNSPVYGQFHKVLGDPDYTPSAGLRRANKLSVMAQTIERPPAGVS